MTRFFIPILVTKRELRSHDVFDRLSIIVLSLNIAVGILSYYYYILLQTHEDCRVSVVRIKKKKKLYIYRVDIIIVSNIISRVSIVVWKNRSIFCCFFFAHHVAYIESAIHCNKSNSSRLIFCFLRVEWTYYLMCNIAPILCRVKRFMKIRKKHKFQSVQWRYNNNNNHTVFSMPKMYWNWIDYLMLFP